MRVKPLRAPTSQRREVPCHRTRGSWRDQRSKSAPIGRSKHTKWPAHAAAASGAVVLRVDLCTDLEELTQRRRPVAAATCNSVPPPGNLASAAVSLLASLGTQPASFRSARWHRAQQLGRDLVACFDITLMPCAQSAKKRAPRVGLGSQRAAASRSGPGGGAPPVWGRSRSDPMLREGGRPARRQLGTRAAGRPMRCRARPRRAMQAAVLRHGCQDVAHTPCSQLSTG